MAALSTPSTSVARSWKRKQSDPVSDDIEHSEMFVKRASSPLWGTISPSTVSELSVDSGMGSDEGKEASEDIDIPKDDIIDSDDSPIYENFHLLVPSSRLNRSIADLTDALTIDCHGSIPPPPPQFLDSIGLVSTAEGSAADFRSFKEQQARYAESEDNICHKGNETSEQIENYYDNEFHGQNPPRIDVHTLRKYKVSRSNFAAFCSKNLNFILDDENTIGNMRHGVENGYERNILNMKEEANIMSVKGTVRGVKNRVKTGIATFLQDQKKKNYIATEGGLCVVFVTSLGIVRETRARCSSVRKILRNLCVRVSERDVLMSREHYHDLRDRLGISDLSTQIPLPQVFLNGQLLGDAALMERLNESGELRKLVKPLQDPVGVQTVCGKCGGFGLFPCPSCDGSKKSGWRSTYSMIILRCTHCDQGGLVRCDQC